MEIRFGKMKKEQGVFKNVDEYKYLGVYIYNTRRQKSARVRLLKQATQYCVKTEKATNVNAGIGKIAWIWWTSSKILYASVSDLALNWIDAEKIEQINLKIIRKIYGIARGVSNKFAIEFFDIAIKNALFRMAEKLRQQMGEFLCIRKKINKSWKKSWIQIAARNDLHINSFWQIIAKFNYSKQGILKCKICREISNFQHLQKHENYDEKIYEFVESINNNGIKSVVDYEKHYGQQELDRIINIAKNAQIKMHSNSEYVKKKIKENQKK